MYLPCYFCQRNLRALALNFTNDDHYTFCPDCKVEHLYTSSKCTRYSFLIKNFQIIKSIQENILHIKQSKHNEEDVEIKIDSQVELSPHDSNILNKIKSIIMFQ